MEIVPLCTIIESKQKVMELVPLCITHEAKRSHGSCSPCQIPLKHCETCPCADWGIGNTTTGKFQIERRREETPDFETKLRGL